MKVLNRSQSSLPTTDWISSVGYEFALACHRNYDVLNGPIVKHWLEDPETGTE